MRIMRRTGLEIPWDMSPTLSTAFVAHCSRKDVGQVGRTRIYRKSDGIAFRPSPRRRRTRSRERFTRNQRSRMSPPIWKPAGHGPVSGRVADVQISKTGQRANVVITADFNLDPSFVKRKRLKFRSAYAGQVPVNASSAADAQGMSGSAAIEQNVEQDDCHGREVLRLTVSWLIQYCCFWPMKRTLSFSTSRNGFVLKIRRTSCL
jgi:hypothetical protein